MRWHRVSWALPGGPAKRASTSGRSANGALCVTRRSSTGSSSSESASASRCRCVQRARRAAATLPTCELFSTRRWAWKAWPSGTSTARLPYQLSSSTVASKPANCNAVARPAPLPLVCTTRSAPGKAASGKAKLAPNAVARAARPGSVSINCTLQPGTRAASQATSRPSVPPPTTATRSPTRGAASQSALIAVSSMAASTARLAGTPGGSGSTASAGTWYKVWCGYRQNTVRPSNSAGPCSTWPTLT